MDKKYQIIYKGKAKDMTPEAIKQGWLKLTRELEKLEPCDFKEVRN